MNTRAKRQPRTRQQQAGAVAIEFAVLFMVLFMVVYAIIAYSIPMLLVLSFKQISADAAREAVRVSPLAETQDDYFRRISQQIYETVDDSWLPANWVQDGCPAPDDGWTKLPSTGGKSFGHYAVVSAKPFEQPRYHLNVCLQRIYNKNGGPTDGSIIPALSFLGVDIPSLPKEGSDTIIRGRSAIRL